MSSSNSFQKQSSVDVQSGPTGTELSPASTNEPSNESEVNPEGVNEPPIEETPSLPQIGNDFGFDIDSIISAGDPEMVKLNKRASNVQKLAQENEKLKAELKAMTDRLEMAERKRQELDRKKESLKERPTA